MNYNWSEEQVILIDSAKSFFKENCPSSLAKELIKSEIGHSAELWQGMVDLGWTGLIFEECYGGMGGSYLDLIAILEEMGKHIPIGPFVPSVVLAGIILSENAENNLKERYLPSLCEGKIILTLAVLEDDASWSSESIHLQAQKNGKEYLVNGKKLFVPYAHLANFILFIARTGDNQDDLSLFIVDSNAEGISRNALITLSGDKQFELCFDNVKIQEEQQIGQKNKGWEIIQRTLPKIIIAHCAQTIGTMQKAMDLTIAHVKERVQFGQPIGSFQSIQHQCVDMLCLIEMAKLQTHYAAWKISSSADCIKDVSMAKSLCSEASVQIAAISHQLHGAIGFTDEYDLHIFTKALRAWETMYGSATDHRKVIAQQISSC